jgi:hypothetical protein
MRYYQWVDIDYTYYLKLFAFIKPFLVEIKEENSFDIGKYHEFCDIAAGLIYKEYTYNIFFRKNCHYDKKFVSYTKYSAVY